MNTVSTQTNNKQYRQCNGCVMDTTDVEITFNEEGNCNHCTNYLLEKFKLSYKGISDDKLLAVMVEVIKKSGRNKKYDCIVGVSGGADGCYVAYICKQLGLRVLLVHMDNGWNSTLAVENIKVIADNLGFDYTSYVLDWEEFRDLQLCFLKASVPEIETPTDVAILGCLHKIANQYKIKYIIMGGNYATEGILPKSWHYNPKDKKHLISIQKQFGTRKLKKFPFFDYGKEIYYKLIKKTKIIYLLNYVPYSRQIAKDVLIDLGWKDYVQKHHESFYTGFIQSYVLPKKFNIDYRKVFLSIKICNGLVSKNEALEILLNKPYNELKIVQDIEYVCKKLGITVDEFNKIMLLPAKTYKDYPNNQKILEFIYKTYHTFNKKVC